MQSTLNRTLSMSLNSTAIPASAPKATKLLFAAFCFLAVSFASPAYADIIDFEELPIPASGYNNGDISLAATHRQPFTITGQGDNAYGDFQTDQYFKTGNTTFGNQFATGSFNSESYDYWSGWSWSNVVDTDNGGYQNQYAAWTGGGSDGNGGSQPGSSYAIGYGDGAWINLDSQLDLQTVQVTNTTYAAKTMLEGANGGKKFGGSSGTDADYFSVTFHGFDGIGLDASELISRTVYLGDYRFADSSQDYILDHWLTVDLSDFENVQQLRLSFAGSDTSIFGLNTPAYVAIDNLSYSAVPEPSSAVLIGFFYVAVPLLRQRRTARLER